MPVRKRSAPTAAPAESNGRRRSGRISNTPQKSKYFEDATSDNEDEDELPPKKRRGRPSKRQSVAAKEDSEDQYEDEPAEEDDNEEEEEEEDGAGDDYDEDEDEDAPPSKKTTGRSSKAKATPVKQKQQQQKKKPQDEEEDDEDAPPKVEIIPHEKLRGTGGVEYEDHKLHKNSLLFLKDLKANNRRPWLKSHDAEYRRSLKDWQSFVEATTQTVIEADETVPELPVKDVIFRIHRDIRFSKDPTPYKAHFSAAWSRTGKKGPYAFYYIHCEPGAAFIGGGLWWPDAQYVGLIRRSIDRHPERWRQALAAPEFKRTFFPDLKAGASDEDAVKAFLDKNKTNALKTKPKGFEVTHPNIGLLKLRNYTVAKNIDADILAGDDAQEKIRDIVRPLVGYISFLNSIVMPDPNADESDDEEEEDEDEDDGE